jgi:hypothetical protein
MKPMAASSMSNFDWRPKNKSLGFRDRREDTELRLIKRLPV